MTPPDHRNHSPAGCALTDQQRDWLQRARVGRLATIDAHGVPAVVPFCFALIANPEPAVVSVLDEKPKRVADRELARVRHIARHPQVGFVVDHYEEDWSRLGFVQVKGVARLLSPEDEAHGGAIAALREKYPQYRAMAIETRPVILIHDLHAHAWHASSQPRRPLFRR